MIAIIIAAIVLFGLVFYCLRLERNIRIKAKPRRYRDKDDASDY